MTRTLQTSAAVMCTEDVSKMEIALIKNKRFPDHESGVIIIKWALAFSSLGNFSTHTPCYHVFPFLPFLSGVRCSQTICFKIQGKMQNSLPSWGLAASGKEAEER